MRSNRFVIALATLLLLAAVAAAQEDRAPVPVDPEIHLDLTAEEVTFFDEAGKPFPIPPTPSPWHELAPVECRGHTQTGYSDNDKDGCLSVCDNIQLDGRWYHIRWVGWTVFCNDGSWYLENADIGISNPTGTPPPTNVVRWFEVAPAYGRSYEVADWRRVDGSRVPFDDSHATPRELLPEVGDVMYFADVRQACQVVRRSVDIKVKRLPGESAP